MMMEEETNSTIENKKEKKKNMKYNNNNNTTLLPEEEQHQKDIEALKAKIKRVRIHSFKPIDRFGNKTENSKNVVVDFSIHMKQNMLHYVYRNYGEDIVIDVLFYCLEGQKNNGLQLKYNVSLE